ncbi:MAG TPA: rod shape-determining protein RodA [Symbiobacteriaceae bacterium]|jgi:rod shape determining protein RodA
MSSPITPGMTVGAGSKKFFMQIDLPLVFLVAAIVTLGLLVVASTTQARFGDYHSFIIRQGGAALVGVVLALLFYRWDYHFLPAFATGLYVLNLLLLALVLVLGHQALGAQRWIALGPFSLQTSETAKLLGILTLAVCLDRQERMDRWQDLLPPLLHIAPVMGLIVIQPDLGTTLVFVVTLAAMIYVAGFPGWRIVLVGTLGLAAIVGWIFLHLRYHVWLPLKPYQLNRLIVFVQPNVDAQGLGYQIGEAKVAIGSGGLWGAGLFKGAITRLNYLPEQFTDFAFAALTEELGFAGAATLLSLFGLFIWRIMRIGSMAKDRLGTLLAVGVGALFSFHIIENIGMNLSVMPVAGIPLPFISYGGSAMLVDVALVGVVLSVWRHRRDIQF